MWEIPCAACAMLPTLQEGNESIQWGKISMPKLLPGIVGCIGAVVIASENSDPQAALVLKLRTESGQELRCRHSSLMRCTSWAFVALSICALHLAPPSGAQPLAGSGPSADVTPPLAQSNPLDKITPVTDALLVHVPEGDWLTWRRGYDATGYSPL